MFKGEVLDGRLTDEVWDLIIGNFNSHFKMCFTEQQLKFCLDYCYSYNQKIEQILEQKECSEWNDETATIMETRNNDWEDYIVCVHLQQLFITQSAICLKGCKPCFQHGATFRLMNKM